MKKFIKFLLRTIIVLFILLNIVVMFHAYKFTHYYEPREYTIIPQEKKTGWDKTKELLFGINGVKQQNTAPDSSYKTIILITKEGIKLEGWMMTVPNSKGTIAMFHGHGGKKSGVLTEAYAFQKMGYNTLLMDFRAHGNSGGNTCTIGFKEAEDVKLAYDTLVRSGEKNIILWGISMGGATIAKAVDEYPEIKPAKIIMEMPFGSLPDAVEGRVRIMHLPVQPISVLLTFWGGTENGFWAFNFKPSEYVKKIKCPVLLQWGKNDPRVTEKETMDIYNNISAEKKLVVYENSAHESLSTKEHDKWVNETSAFLSR
jgi:uncharacterized protein